MKMTGSAQEEQKDAPAECSHRAIGTRFGENFPDVAQHTMRWQTHALSADFPAGACQRLSSLATDSSVLQFTGCTARLRLIKTKHPRQNRIVPQGSSCRTLLCIVLYTNCSTKVGGVAFEHSYLETYYLVASLGPAYTRTQAVPRVDKPDTIQHVCARSHKRIRSPLFIGTPA